MVLLTPYYSITGLSLRTQHAIMQLLHIIPRVQPIVLFSNRFITTPVLILSFHERIRIPTRRQNAPQRDVSVITPFLKTTYHRIIGRDITSGILANVTIILYSRITCFPNCVLMDIKLAHIYVIKLTLYDLMIWWDESIKKSTWKDRLQCLRKVIVIPQEVS